MYTQMCNSISKYDISIVIQLAPKPVRHMLFMHAIWLQLAKPVHLWREKALAPQEDNAGIMYVC